MEIVKSSRLRNLIFIASIRMLLVGHSFIFPLKTLAIPQSLASFPNHSSVGREKTRSLDLALQAYEMGFREYKYGNFPQAEIFFLKALENEPNLLKAHYWLGKLYREMGMLVESVFHWEETLKLKKLIHERRLALSIQNNEYPAISQIQTTRNNIKKAQEAFNRSRRFLQEGQWNAALAESKTAVSLYPRNPSYLLSLARLQRDLGDLQGCENSFSELLKTPNLPKEQVFEAIEHFTTTKNKHLAIQILKELSLRFPNDSKVAPLLAGLKKGREEAIVSVGKVIKREPGQVVLDIGLNQGIKLADEFQLRFQAFRPGLPIVDKPSNRTLGRETDEISGELLLTKVFSDSSWALIKREIGSGVKAGDLIEIKSPYARPKY